MTTTSHLPVTIVASNFCPSKESQGNLRKREEKLMNLGRGYISPAGQSIHLIGSLLLSLEFDLN